MSEFQISKLTISVIIGVMIIIAGVGLLYSTYTNNPDPLSQNEILTLNNTFYKYDDIQNAATGLKGSITGTNTSDNGFVNAIDSLVTGSWNSVKLFYSSFAFVFAFFDGLAVISGIPGWIIGLLSAIIIILVGYAIYGLIFGRQA